MKVTKKLFIMGLALVLTFIGFKPIDVRAEENITIYTQAPSDWSDVSLWAWSAPDGTNAFLTWPGNAMLPDENNPGWFYHDVPNWVNSIIINGNLGTVQTSDMAIEAKDVWVIVTAPDSVELSYEAPEGFSFEAEAVEDIQVDKTEEIAKTGIQSNLSLYLLLMMGCIGGVVVFMRNKKVHN